MHGAVCRPSGNVDLGDDLNWVRQLGRRDPQAFRTLVDSEAGYLYGIAYALAGNAADADDIVQETFTVAMEGRFRGECAVRTWLVQILVRRSAMLRRSRRRHQAKLIAGAEGSTPRNPGGPYGNADTDARLDLTTMLQALSHEQRTVIVLRELQGMTYAEMAETLQVPQGTVESRLYRAREELRRRFEGYL